jgi:hypothetical protein
MDGMTAGHVPRGPWQPSMQAFAGPKACAVRTWQPSAPNGRATWTQARHERGLRGRSRSYTAALCGLFGFGLPRMERRAPVVIATTSPAMMPALTMPCGHPVRPQNGQLEALTMNPKYAAHRKRSRAQSPLRRVARNPGGMFVTAAIPERVIANPLTEINRPRRPQFRGCCGARRRAPRPPRIARRGRRWRGEPPR